MNKYLCCIILGIIIFLLLNRYDGFSVGIPTECSATTALIDPTIPQVNLINIVEDNFWFSSSPFEDDYIGQNKPIYKVNDFADLPCKLLIRYTPQTSGGLPLKYVSIIDSGSFGTVYKYSTHFRYEGQTDYATIAVKKFTDQTDPEINILLSIEEVAPDQGINICDIVVARILLVGTRPLRKYVCIMEYMDGTLENLHNLTVDNFKGIIRWIAIAFKCISDAGYCYTDLKPSNILIKRINFDRVKYRLGDIGSIIRNNTLGNSITSYPPPEYMILSRNDYNNDQLMIWTIGVLIALLYGYGKNHLRYLAYIDLIGTDNQQLLDTYYRRNISDIRSEVNSIPDGTRINSKIKEILEGTLTRPNDRISFDRIIELTY